MYGVYISTIREKTLLCYDTTALHLKKYLKVHVKSYLRHLPFHFIELLVPVPQGMSASGSGMLGSMWGGGRMRSGRQSLANDTAAANLTGTYRQVSDIRRTLVGNTIVDHSDVVGASPVGAAPTTSSFST